jgi:hypothetical protein
MNTEVIEVDVSLAQGYTRSSLGTVRPESAVATASEKLEGDILKERRDLQNVATNTKPLGGTCPPAAAHE